VLCEAITGLQHFTFKSADILYTLKKTLILFSP